MNVVFTKCKMHIRHIASIAILIIAGACSVLTSNLHGREKANYMVKMIGEHLNVSEARLDSDNDHSFGEFGFHYDSQRDVLVGRVFVAKAYLRGESAETIEGFRNSARILNNPKFGGLFEGGGHFVLDEVKEIYFLTEEFPVESTTDSELWDKMQDLTDLAGRWQFKWLRHVLSISRGKEAPPSFSVNRKNDPYVRN